tara:strand:- start:154 stop:351 length:198 start_codon:yes stop_codon:yes gene_type:complete
LALPDRLHPMAMCLGRARRRLPDLLELSRRIAHARQPHVPDLLERELYISRLERRALPETISSGI